MLAYLAEGTDGASAIDRMDRRFAAAAGVRPAAHLQRRGGVRAPRPGPGRRLAPGLEAERAERVGGAADGVGQRRVRGLELRDLVAQVVDDALARRPR